MVKKGDLIGKLHKNKDYADIFQCVCADNEVFVIGRAKFRQVGEVYEVCGVSYENLRAFENTDKALTENNLILLED